MAFAARRELRMPQDDNPIIPPVLLPQADEQRDWTEGACLIHVAVGVVYFVAHFVVAAARGLLW
ncbi:hypothetical protein GCM10022253_23820 [Sphingomonas endophytica]